MCDWGGYHRRGDTLIKGQRIRVRYGSHECDAIAEDKSLDAVILLDPPGVDGWAVNDYDREKRLVPDGVLRGWFANLGSKVDGVDDAILRLVTEAASPAPTSPLKSACSKLGDVLEEKAKAYGNSHKTKGDFLRLLFPEGIPPAAFEDAMTMSRIFEKFKRIANNVGKPDPGGESPWMDSAGESVLAWVRRGG